ncbi:MAG: FIST C-terminal domain-containing protein [Candidatus Omnitrophica bacterium]|nr:FIST C-terminal domain-containing protein [Candidatus Omnitrophota bacterium]MCM8799703.1 FIST C-terminal domain-containing protein [Candidatus Omnitrophota bacterium]
MQVGIGISTKNEPSLAIEEAFWQAKIQISSSKPNVCFIFSSPEFASPLLLKKIYPYLLDIPVVGCSTLAIFYNSHIYRHGVLVLLIQMEGVNLSVGVVKEIKKKGSLIAGEELGKELLKNFKSSQRDFAMLFCDGLLDEGSQLLRGLQERLGTSFPIVGGSASDNLRFLKTYLYFNKEILTDSAIALLWGGKLNFSLSFRHGWKPVGKSHTVNEAKGNLIKKIDQKPAVELYQEYFAKDNFELKKDLKLISSLYPLGIYLEGEQEYLLRNIRSIQDDGSLICQGDVPEGSTVKIMIGTKQTCLLATREATEELKENFFSLPYKKKMDLVFSWSSTSRYILLKREAEEELNIIQKILGENIPLIGIYTYGEQAPLKAITYQGKTHFHNQSIVLLAL